MKKMNKKGFTLIEMLVVIAIIAVLVSIIIPTVTSATDKAAAATNAANLRSVKAEITTALLTSDSPVTASGITFTAVANANYTVANAANVKATFKDVTSVTMPTGYTKEGDFDADGGFSVVVTKDKVVTVKYDGLTINDWAALAG